MYSITLKVVPEYYTMQLTEQARGREIVKISRRNNDILCYWNVSGLRTIIAFLQKEPNIVVLFLANTDIKGFAGKGSHCSSVHRQLLGACQVAPTVEHGAASNCRSCQHSYRIWKLKKRTLKDHLLNMER